MNRGRTQNAFLDALAERVLVYDGAMGTNLQLMNLDAAAFGGEHLAGCIDYLVISQPSAVETVHRSFLKIGVDVIETCTFRSNRITLAEYGLQNLVHTINRAAAVLARRLADEYSQPGKPRFVAGSMGPSGKLPSMNDPDLSNITFDQLAVVFEEQALGLIDGGVDVLLIETAQDILEVKAAIAGIQRAFEIKSIRLPIQCQVTLDTTGRMLLGTDINAVLAILEDIGIDIIGLNCSTGPGHMRDPIQILGELSNLPVSCIPNAGLPINVDGQAVYPLEPEPFASEMLEFVDRYQVNLVGGCCGTTPDHLKLLVEKLQGHPQAHRRPAVMPRLASAIQAMPMQQQPPPFLIGERLNTQGSQKFKQLILAEDFDGILSIVRQQMESGAHALDLCVALTEGGDEVELMQRVIKTLTPVTPLPLVIDTTELPVLEAALKTAPGRCLINSTHLEGGKLKMDAVLALARRHNAAAIALTIDEDGMAKTANRKVEVARRIFKIAINEHGLEPHDLVFDALTFTLATGDPEFADSAIETLEGIRRIKTELKGVLTSLGISNVSFGLSAPARAVLNSVMLYHAVRAGLDMAIVNPSHITPYSEITSEERQLAEDLIFNKHPHALQRYIEHYEKFGDASRAIRDDSTESLKKLFAEERLHWRILHRQKEAVEQDIDEIIQRPSTESRHQTAVRIINSVLLPAMQDVGDRFGAGELILPFVLQSAEVMKKAVSYVEQYLEKNEGVTKGTMVLATVYGDVHDIGKNLVKTILSNNGYQVVDLGKQVPAETIISKAVEINAAAIGLSALLVSTSKQMPLIVNELNRRKLDFPVLIGGAAINLRFGRRILLTDEGHYYQGGVFYCKDAFEGLKTMQDLGKPELRRELLLELQKNADFERRRTGKDETAPIAAIRRSKTPPAGFIPKPKVWGARVVSEMPLEAVFEYLPINELFRLSWGAKNTRGNAWINLQAEFDERLARMKKEALMNSWLQPQGVYGAWHAQSDGDDLIIYDPQSVLAGIPAEMMRFNFPRQQGDEALCLADYFAPVESGVMDVVVFQLVTVGQCATERFDTLQESGNYSEAYFTHGLSVQTAEACAEYLHRHIRRELGIPEGQGKRYSWGYPAIPELADHAKVFQLLPAQKALGMTLTEAYQLVPEQSTAAIVVHHPQARYFNTGEKRLDQLQK